MRLIEKIEISRFRSLNEVVVDSLGDFSAFAGLNNSGKSNILRALNAFFNDTTDPELPIRVDSDFYRSPKRSRKKRRIRVKVSFNLPDQFKFRKGLESASAFLKRRFSITKEWVRNEVQPRYYLNDNDELSLNLEDREKVIQFLSLVAFRYIPNRVLPLDVIKHEHQALRDVLIRRLGAKAKQGNELFQAVAKTSERLIQGLTDSVHNVAHEIRNIRLATPTSLAEMVFAFGYRLNEGGVELDDSVQGSGLQSYLMFQTLHLIDKDYFQKFGWRQAAIWAVEEPESSLHTSLEANVGSLLSHIAKEQNGRLQILSSTHSNLIVQHADRAYFVEKHSAGSSITALQPFEIITRTANAGVSEWVHPLLYHPLEPLVIVEGKYDETFISKALRLMGKDHLCRVSYLERLTDDGSTGGIESTLKYLRSNRSAIKSRRRGAPVVMVLDWESKNRKKHFEELFTASDPFYALCWPETDCNPKLGKTFRGIERFYSDRIIRLAESTGVNISRNRGGIAVVDRDEYGDIKQAMSKVVASHLEIRDLIFAKNCLDLIVSHVLGSTSPQKV